MRGDVTVLSSVVIWNMVVVNYQNPVAELDVADGFDTEKPKPEPEPIQLIPESLTPVHGAGERIDTNSEGYKTWMKAIGLSQVTGKESEREKRTRLAHETIQ